MRWLLHGNVAGAVAEALRRRGDEASTAAEKGLAPDAAPADVVRAAHAAQLDLLTTDAACATAPFEEKVPFGRCIVFLRVPEGEVEQDDAVERFFQRYARPTPGRLYTVTGSRVKVRQLPGKGR